MNIFEKFKVSIMKKLGLAKLSSDPNSERYTYINDEEAIRISSIRENRTWYIGNSNELLNWYTPMQTYGWAKNPIYNRNNRQMFWGMSVNEMVKRIHSSIPRAIVDTISNVVGMPDITSPDVRLQDIFDANNFDFMLTQRSRPMTLVEGDGAWKINICPQLSNHPLLEWYGAEDWAPVDKSNVTLGMLFKSYYKDKNNKDYVLFESRSLRPEGLAIEYQLYVLDKSNNITPCSLEKIPELAGLKNQLIEGLHCLLAISNRYYFNPLYPNRGKSVYDGNIDLFDEMDEILTQAGQTNRVSTPVEYYPVDLLQRTRDGQPVLPKLYNRQFVKIEGTPDGDGNISNTIQTTQPDLDFDKYMQLYNDILGTVLIGILSPSSLGIDIAKKDNADAQREKEKQTIFTRNTIINNETKALQKLCEMLLMCQDYLDYGVFQEKEYEISIKYDEFANPSFESELQILGPAWNNGQISTERYVSLLWSGKLSDEDMLAEIQWLDDNKKNDDFDLNSLMEHENEKRIGLDNRPEEQEQEEPVVAEE